MKRIVLVLLVHLSVVALCAIYLVWRWLELRPPKPWAVLSIAVVGGAVA